LGAVIEEASANVVVDNETPSTLAILSSSSVALDCTAEERKFDHGDDDEIATTGAKRQRVSDDGNFLVGSSVSM